MALEQVRQVCAADACAAYTLRRPIKLVVQSTCSCQHVVDCHKMWKRSKMPWNMKYNGVGAGVINCLWRIVDSRGRVVNCRWRVVNCRCGKCARRTRAPPTPSAATPGMRYYLHLYVYMHMYICICIHIYIYVCIYVYIYIYIYIYISYIDLKWYSADACAAYTLRRHAGNEVLPVHISLYRDRWIARFR